jgi:hypothetical protein
VVDDTWTIGELAELASGVLTDSTPRQVSGRVREVPNDRLIRWYVTVGLVDPPLSRVGRIARYGRRHLLQLVAVKRRQAEGCSLAAIQAELVGATDAYLESVARIPANGSGPGGQAAPGSTALNSVAGGSAPPGRAAADDRFWRRGPAPDPATPLESGRAESRPPPESSPERTGPADLLSGIRLAPGVLLLLDAGGSGVRAADAAELRAAAAPLIRALARHGYRTGSEDQERNRP